MFRNIASDIRYRVRALVSRKRLEQDLDEELRFHIDREAEKYERQGIE